jgi:hypothetical protein
MANMEKPTILLKRSQENPSTSTAIHAAPMAMDGNIVTSVPNS